MEKLKLQSFVKQYVLKNVVDDVLWVVEDKSLNCMFQDENRKVYGNITIPDFNIQDGNYPIKESIKLLKSISILDDAVFLKDAGHLIVITDKTYDIEVLKADMSVVESEREIWEELYPNSDPYYKTTVEPAFIEQYLKAFKVTQTTDQTSFSIDCSDEVLEFKIGYGRKIKFKVDATECIDEQFIGIYPVNIFANMLEANKECDEIQIEVHPMFIYLDFYYSSGTIAKYIVVQLEEEIE